MKCAICEGVSFEPVTTVSRSVMVDVAGALEARRRTFEISRCRVCDHVQVTTPQTYQALFELYNTYVYKEAQTLKAEPVRHPGDVVVTRPKAESVYPHYTDMLAYAQPYMLMTKDAIVDLGCGPGTILRQLRDAYHLPAKRLIGIDFLQHLEPEHGIDLIVADLNDLDETAELACLPEPVGFLFCCHVLEHMIEPRRLLRFARKLLSPTGHMYVEVPDHTVTHPRNVPGEPEYIILVAPEHLQYYCPSSLAALVQSCGFEIIKSERIQTYDGFLPRLKMLLRPTPSSGVAALVSYCMDRSDGSWPAVGRRVAAAIDQHPSVALWGCGFGLLQMLGAEPTLQAKIEARRVEVFDNKLFGKSLAGRPILDDAGLRDFAGTIVLTPALSASREAMKETIRGLGVPSERVFDPYV